MTVVLRKRASSMPDVKALLQLGRVPNVFTAVSNVTAAYLLTHADLFDVAAVSLLIAATVCLYTAGMVLNDVFDAEVDARERPARPIPSGRVSLGAAKKIGWTLLGGGLAATFVLAGLRLTPTPAIVGTALAACIVAYDAFLKHTPLGPLAMGLCRTLNVLLGLSFAAVGPFAWHPLHACVAAGIGAYVVGLTIFARNEAEAENRRGPLLLGMLVMLGGAALLAYFPRLTDGRLPFEAQPLRSITSGPLWLLLWGVFGFFIVRRCLPAVVSGSPDLVKFAVKQSIFALVIFDAAVCTAVRGPVPYALLIVALLVPMQLLGRTVYST